MSQRTALLISLALTVLVGFAIVSNRDRLLGTSASENISTPTATAVVENTTGTVTSGAQTNPRVVEITLPPAQSGQTAAQSTKDDDRYGDDDRNDDHGEDDDRGGNDGHEEEDDD